MESIINKIKKLLAMSLENGASEQEAETAMQKVHALLAEHNLNLSEIKDSNDNGLIETGLIDYKTDEWRAWIWTAIAKLYFCYQYRQPRKDATGKRYNRRVIIGTAENIEIVKQVGTYICGAIEGMAKIECKGMGRAYFSQFKKGMAHRLTIRIKEQIEAAKKGEVRTESGTGLVLASFYERNSKALTAYISQQGVKLKTSTARVQMDSAYSRGIEAGDRINWNKSLNTTLVATGRLS